MIFEVISLTVLFLVITVVFRILFGPIMKYYKKVGIKFHLHHMYFGFLGLILSIYFHYDLLIILGWSLLLSDAIYHFLFLPLWHKPIEFP